MSEGLTRGSRIDDPKRHESLAKQGFKGIVDLTLEGTTDATAGWLAERILGVDKELVDFLDAGYVSTR